MDIWLSLVGSKFEAGTKVRKAVGYSSRPGHSGPVVTGLLFGFLDWLSEIEV